jgi:predicted Ser/Thr protein kinase
MSLESLGPYRIERCLGRGGMGAVYAGVHQETGERAAIKVLSESLACDPRFRERFLAEVETLKKLRHPNIVTLQGYGEEDERLFFVMELVDGPSLDAILHAGRRFTWQEVVAITTQICAALKHAHDHGVIHRDLKPANLLYLPDGTVKLTDFGIAKFYGSTGLTLAGSMIGTPDYMSPEQTEGRPVTPRSDLYGLGCVMYALIVGKPPFHGPSVTQVIDSVRFQEPASLSRVAPQVPEALADIVGQLLRKNPEDRIATPLLLSNLLQAMRHALATAGTAVIPPAAPPSPGTVSTPTPPARPAAGTAVLDPTSQRPTVDYVAGKAAQPAAPVTVSAGSAEEPAPTLVHEPEVDAALLELAPEAERKRQFVTVSETDWKQQIQSRAGGWSRREWWSVAGLALAVAVILVAFVVALRPPSADRLHSRILQVSPPPDDLSEEYELLLQEFLTRYPDDPRAAEISSLQAGYRCRKLRDELRHKLRGLTDAEKLYLQGLDHVDQLQVDEARDCFRQILATCRPDSTNVHDRKLAEQSQTILDKLSP